MTTATRHDYIVRIDDATGRALEATAGETFCPHVDGTTQYHLSLVSSHAEALERGERIHASMAKVRAKIAREARMTTLRPSTFSIDDGDAYPGYTYGHTWNGWAMPYFTREVAQALVAYWNTGFTATTHAHYEAATDTFVFCDDNVDDPDTFQGETHTVGSEPVTLYPIGNGCWCWEMDTPEEG